MVISLKERRDFPRIALRNALHYQLLGKTEYGNVVMENISPGGVAFRNDKFMSPRTILRLEFSLFSRVLRPTGRITWSSPVPYSDRYRVGVEFLNFEDPAEKRELLDYIQLKTRHA